MTHKSHDPLGVPSDTLRCLIRWPEGSVGWQREEALIKALNDLCKLFGYGRVPQVAEQIEQIWRDPDKVAKFLEEQRQHNEFVASCRKAMEEGDDTGHSQAGR